MHSFCLVSKLVHNEAKGSKLSEMRNRVKVKLTSSSVPLINRFTVTASRFGQREWFYSTNPCLNNLPPWIIPFIIECECNITHTELQNMIERKRENMRLQLGNQPSSSIFSLGYIQSWYFLPLLFKPGLN